MKFCIGRDALFRKKMERNEIKISDYTYDLPDERIAKFPLQRRDQSKLLVYRDGTISESRFASVGSYLPSSSLLVFNNTRVIHARLIFYKSSGARIEIFCLEPQQPADYERAFAVKESCQWHCMVGNAKRWRGQELSIDFEIDGSPAHLVAERIEQHENDCIVRFRWNTPHTFGQLLEVLGRIPIPPYLRRESEAIDDTRYQTVYSKFDGSVAAPTAGLHFTPDIIEALRREGHQTEEVTLHVGAGTFLPVKVDRVVEHSMHTEHFEIRLSTLRALIASAGNVTAVGTTSMRTLESLPALGYRILSTGDPDPERAIGQWELYAIPAQYSGRQLLEALADYLERGGMQRLKTSTQIMIMPGFRFRVVTSLVTNFHQPQSTLLLLVSAFVGADWRCIYRYALDHEFRFLSYGDSSVLIPKLSEATCLMR